jgi:N-acetylneuraminate synthase/sialic acid synthase
MRKLSINRIPITDEGENFIIAEIGNNHQGSIDTAIEMIKTAKVCGVNAVKFQKRDNRSLYTREILDKSYENENSFGKTYGQHREFLEFGKSQYVQLKNCAEQLGLAFIVTAFDFKSADFLTELDISAYKIASGDLKNIPLIKYIARMQKPIIISTGGGELEDVQRVYDTVMPINPQFCILQCTASYPCKAKEMNLRVISTYREKFTDIIIGLSDHQNGISMALAAYVLGARVFEKHFTLDHTWKGPDHAFSLEPIGLAKLVRDLKRARVAMGDGIKRPYPSETIPLFKMGKKIVAAKNLPANHKITIKDITIKSPNDGLPPYKIEEIIGKTTAKSVKADESILLKNLKN